MAGASSDGEMNYWPGFVDALANLVLALVFVVVIFTLALAVISAKVAKEAAAREIERMRNEDSRSQLEKDLRAQIAQLQQQLKDSQLKLEVAVKDVPKPPPLAKQASIVGQEIIFTYEPGAFELGPEAVAELDKMVKMKGGLAGKNIKLTAFQASGAFSSEKRAAYFRMITLRNLLIDRGASPANIATSTAPETLPGLKGQVKVGFGGK